MYNQEVKGNLAKLLATENLIVEHKNVSTASFDVDRRVLILPNWQRASNTVYDLLVGHEVGHALFTPNSDWDFSIPKDYINVIEDARIEKMMKRKYPGFSKTFYRGYQELNDDNFFCIKEDEINKINLIDRINLYFKIGSFSCIEFNEQEQEFIERTENAETFEEVQQIALDVYNYTKNNKKQENINIQSDNTSASAGRSSESIEMEKQQSEEEFSVSNDTTIKSESKNEEALSSTGKLNQDKQDKVDNSGGHNNDDLSSVTDKAFQENQKDFIDNYTQDTIYVEVPDIKLDNIVVDYKLLGDHCNQFYNDIPIYADAIKQFDLAYSNFYKESINGVNYLVKEFECKKSADAYSRTSTARTGVLDCTKLHTYKFNDDLFKKINVIPDGKNHGLIFILDWSGSMSDVILDTVKQLLNLVWFCKKVQIPFEVYAFTYEFAGIHNSLVGRCADDKIEIQEKRPGDIVVHESFRLLNLISHRCNTKDFENQCKYMWRIAYSENKGYSPIPSGLGLSGTPLNETLIALKKMIPEFIKQNAIQKANVIILTDGESAGLARYTTVKRWDRPDEDMIGMAGVTSMCCLRDRKTGHIYKTFKKEHNVTKTLINNLRDNYPNVNFIGFRILPSSQVSSFYWTHEPKISYDEYRKIWNKQRSFIIEDSGYHVLYGISSTSLNQSEQFIVDENATNSQIKSAFQKSLKSKCLNKKILSSFITVVA